MGRCLIENATRREYTSGAKVTGYHRKHAIRILTAQLMPPPERPAAHRICGEAVKEALIVLWEAADRICGKRLKMLLPQLMEAMERHKHLRLEQEVRAQLLAMSSATIDRHLCSVREHAYGGRKKRTALNRVRKMVRPTHRRQPKPGRWWRTREDPFAEVLPVLLGWLEERPDLEAKEMLTRLQASGFGEFPDGQLRTLQRRVRLWRMRIVQQLVYGTDHSVPREEDRSLG